VRPIATRTCLVRSPCGRWVYGMNGIPPRCAYPRLAERLHPVMPSGASSRDGSRALCRTNLQSADAMPRRASPGKALPGGLARRGRVGPRIQSTQPMETEVTLRATER
jgi:hypothetical protein